MTAGVITTTAGNPFDVVKTQYLADCNGKYASVFDCTYQVFRTGGIKAFFRGWFPAYWRIGPHTVISLLIVEKLRMLLRMEGI